MVCRPQSRCDELDACPQPKCQTRNRLPAVLPILSVWHTTCSAIYSHSHKQYPEAMNYVASPPEAPCGWTDGLVRLYGARSLSLEDVIGVRILPATDSWIADTPSADRCGPIGLRAMTALFYASFREKIQGSHAGKQFKLTGKNTSGRLSFRISDLLTCCVHVSAI